ncbi:MAG: trigger factor [Deltaproteobacteria bacterium RIFCSPHIGHO2_12_FULL_43_9]|nr:MAG: trigger factor [Deltaproteobacteria bacterium RIFCSPHIGHO2_12_FULL_43_9]
MKVKYSVEKLNPYERKLTVSMPWEEVEKIQSDVIFGIQKEAKISGFRPGKVPVEIVKERFKPEIEKETLHKSVELSCRHIIEETKLVPLTNPTVDGGVIKEGNPLNFVAHLEVRPEISLKGYKNIEIKKENIEVRDSEIDESLKYIQHQFLSFKPLPEDTVAREGYFVNIDFKGLIGGAPFPGNEGKGAILELGKNAFILGFDKNLEGMKKGETKSFDLKFPGDYGVKDLAGKDVTFTVIVNSVEEKILPTLDDNFAKSVGEFNSLDALREDIKKKTMVAKEREASAKLKDAFLKELIRLNPFAAPPSLIQREKAMIWNHLASRLMHQGVKEDALKEYADKWEGEIRELAINKVKSNLILTEIASKEGIKIAEEELRTEAQRIAQTVDPKNRDRLLKSFDFYDLLHLDLLRERVLDFLIKEAKT